MYNDDMKIISHAHVLIYPCITLHATSQVSALLVSTTRQSKIMSSVWDSIIIQAHRRDK